MNIQQLLDLTIQRNASDLHLSVGFPPTLRIHGELITVPGETPTSPEQIESLIRPLLTDLQSNIYKQVFELDFSFEFEKRARFRVNLFRQKGYPAVDIPIEDLEDYYDALDKYQIEGDEMPFTRYIYKKYMQAN